MLKAGRGNYGNQVDALSMIYVMMFILGLAILFLTVLAVALR